MRDTKLIFIEGLPGLGKSTTASAIARSVQAEHLTVNLLLETQANHPLNVGGDLHPAGFITGEVFFARYKPDNFIQESLERWEAFIQSALQSEVIHVLDSFPYQNSIRILLQMDASIEVLQEYAERVENMVMPLLPSLIYFNQVNTTQAFEHMQRITTQRGKEWTDYVIKLVTDSPYAHTRNLTGYEGLLFFIREYKHIMEMLLSRSHIPRIILDNCASDWEKCYKKIASFLEISL